MPHFDITVHADVTSAGEYLRYKYLDTYLRYVKSILYLVSMIHFQQVSCIRYLIYHVFCIFSFVSDTDTLCKTDL